MAAEVVDEHRNAISKFTSGPSAFGSRRVIQRSDLVMPMSVQLVLLRIWQVYRKPRLLHPPPMRVEQGRRKTAACWIFGA